MYDLKDIKDKIEIKEKTVTCPVKGCKNEVRRIRRGEILIQKDFLCPDHKIYISPSTFEYDNEYSNLLSHNQKDKELLNKIKSAKRGSRISRERSEDALTWNTFRHLERQNYIEPFIRNILGVKLSNPQLIYWSFCEKELIHPKGVLKELYNVRRFFHEKENQSTEPDIIIKDKNTIIFIEAKFTSGNNTSGNDSKKKFLRENPKNYNSQWIFKVFKSKYDDLINSGYYELMRLWLLGTKMAYNDKKSFWLINITREKSEQNIEQNFKPLINENNKKHFKRLTWESIYDFVKGIGKDEDMSFIKYIENKTCGFSDSGKRHKAFNR